MMKKTNLEKNVEHYKAEGVKLTGMKQFNLMSNSTFLYKKAKSNLLGESCTVYHSIPFHFHSPLQLSAQGVSESMPWEKIIVNK